MSFQRSAETLSAKIHLGNKRLLLLIAVSSVVLLIIANLLFQAFVVSKGEAWTIEHNSEVSDNISQVDESAESSVSLIVVHVGGAVVSPGICELPQGSRVNDAISACGGFADGAATDALNLARVLSDGEQILVPLIEDMDSNVSSETASPSSSQSSGKVNINTANIDELDALPGVGPSTAQKIVDDRSTNGPFVTIEDLKRVSGIGDKKFNALADYICIG